MARTIKPIASRLTCTEEMLDYLSYLSAENGSTNKDERLKMVEFIKTAMQIELTQRQRRCITEYYLNNKSLKEIANELGLSSQSTVSYHISRGIEKIKKRVEYYNIYLIRNSEDE
ncbi:MAG: LuxR C-terminal-related transcriptional regulator [Clostridiales bacterium]|nr:LuxR C-terminal-related transcriptional regulator [Clostridiales bacterium]